MKSSHPLAVLLLASVVGSSAVQAQTGIDGKTRDLLIQKLNQVYMNLAPSDPSRTAITMRLADLHAEKARTDSMQELNAGCTTCNAGKEDRLKALELYKSVIAKVPPSTLPKIMTQVGHLYELVGQEKDAVATYETILKEQKSPEVLAEANLSLGEVYFKHRDFKKARGYFAAVMATPEAGSKGLAAYRVAWCDFNDGQVQPAIDQITTILKTPALLNRSSRADVVQVDTQFQEEVSRDLATFLAKRQLTIQDGELVYSLSPEMAKIANVTYLASEAERVGQIPASIALWRFVGDRQTKPDQRLEGHIHLANLEMTQKLLPDAIKDYDQALSLWSQLGTDCSAAGNSAVQCKELQTRLRNFVVDWNRVEKKAPSPELLAAYKGYLKVFTNEAEMTIWAAKVASDLKDYASAVSLYETGAKLALAEKDGGAHLEAALLGGIESAELSKQTPLLKTAYDNYISMSREKTKITEVQYQKAHILYDAGENAAAADALREVALKDDPKQLTIRKQAADLSLDALVQLKDDQKLEAWSADYAKAFPKDAKEFAAISRKSVLTQSAKEAGTSGDAAALAAAWTTLNRFDVGSATADERIAFYKNKLILAEKMQKFADARDAVDQLLRQPSLPGADQQFALARKAWLAELVLDFDTALTASEKITTSDFSGDKKWLKLAMFAELASKDPKPFYTQFLKDSKDEDKNAAIAAQFVRDSKEPLKEIDRQKAVLSKRPELLANLYLDIFAKSASLDIAKKGLASPGVAKTSAGQVLARSILLDDISKLHAKMDAQKIDSASQRKLASTLKARVALIDDAEKLAARAVDSGDWTSQLVALDLLAKQHDRFYQEVLALPVPAGLSGEDEQQYLQLLSQQAAPHQLRANDVNKKIGEFWADQKAMDQLASSMKNETDPRRTLLVKELSALAAVAPADKKTTLTAMIDAPENKVEHPQLTSVEAARQAVRDNPMDRSRIESLLAIEKEMGHGPMVAYLEGRVGTLEPATADKAPAKGVN